MTNNGCKRYCEVMNRPAYIVLFKGDDSDFEGNQSVDIVIDTELDTTGMKAHFRFMDFVQDFDSIPENKTLSLVFPNAKTSEFPLGAADATLRLEDASGKFRTISNRIHIVVTNSVNEAYNNEDNQSITVTVKGTVTWEMINGKPTFAPVATSGSYNDLTDKPTIPEPVTIDPALSQTSENPVQNKVVSKALYTGFTEWELTTDNLPQGSSFRGVVWYESQWVVTIFDGIGEIGIPTGEGEDAVSITFEYNGSTNITTRHLITPTKTSQLTNDGPSSGPNVGHPFATTNQIPTPVDISGKLDGEAAYPAWEAGPYGENSIVSHNGKLWKCLLATTVEPPSEDWEEVTLQSLLAAKQDALSSAQLAATNSGATAAKVATWDGYAGQIAQKANSADVNAALAQKASLTDLPYALVTPGVWAFNDGQEHTVQGPYEIGDTWGYLLDSTYSCREVFETEEAARSALSLAFMIDDSDDVVATRPSLPGHLLDRAVNAVAVSAATELTMPAATAGKARDFLVLIDIPSSVADVTGLITFSPSGSETLHYYVEGADASTAEFPEPTAVGEWSYSFSEFKAGWLAVSLKQIVEAVPPTQSQGGNA